QSTGSGEQGVIQATYNARNAQVVVTVISEQVFIPSDGLNFHPDVYRIRQGQLSHISLYADLSKVDKSNESISITSSSTVIQLDAKVMKLSEGKMINDKIIKFEIPIIGYKIGGAARITAVCGEFKALANITIVKKKDPTDTSPKGIFSDIKFGKLAVKHQTTYDPMTGIIIINTEHPINKMYFGEDPDLVVRTLPHCQVLQAELVLSECLNYMVQKAISENKLPRRTTHEPTDIQHYILESKLNIGNEIHKILVDHQLLKEMTKNYGTDQLASTHTETNTKTAISGKRRSDSNDMLSMPPGYLRQVILQVLSTRPNQSCKKDALTGLVLAHLNIRTRGKPRQDFDHRVNRMLSSMKRQSIVEIYKSRNVRVRINRQSGTQQMLAL
ncbi:MAG: hypothetical protein GY861_19325, partial [bacterium]|nr:hypothetical protein [bacterium]